MTLTYNQNARLSGFFYLLVVLTGIFSLMYVPMKLIYWNDPSLTITAITGNLMLFRWGIINSLLCYMFFIFLLLSFYKLLQEVNKTHATIMLILGLCSIPVAVFSVHYQLNIIDVVLNFEKSIYTSEEAGKLVFQNLNGYGNGLFVADLFWSTWLFPLGYLIFNSKKLPTFLGALLMMGSLCYFLHFAFKILFPDASLTEWLRQPASVAEIGTCLWFLIMGSKRLFKKKPDTTKTYG